MKKIVLRKNGGFYCAYGNDCYILNYLFDYKITDNSDFGFSFLGYKFVVSSKKTRIFVSKSTSFRITRRVNCIIKNYSNENYNYIYSSIVNYYNSFKYSKSLKLKRIINRCINNESSV